MSDPIESDDRILDSTKGSLRPPAKAALYKTGGGGPGLLSRSANCGRCSHLTLTNCKRNICISYH